MTDRPIKTPGPDHPITVARNSKRVVVTLGGKVIADTCDALTLREASYPPVQYIPREDVRMDRLAKTQHHTHCPYKGDASYFSVKAGGKTSENAVWSYEQPFEAVGEIGLWRVAVQPGKPFAFGVVEHDDGGPPTLLFGLPGNPVSSFVTFELFVRPALLAAQGRRRLNRPRVHAIAAERIDVSKRSGRRAFLRVVTERDGDGATVRDDAGRVPVRLAGGGRGQGSHVLSALAAADALAIVPESVDALPAGADVDLWWLDRD